MPPVFREHALLARLPAPAHKLRSGVLPVLRVFVINYESDDLVTARKTKSSFFD